MKHSKEELVAIMDDDVDLNVATAVLMLCENLEEIDARITSGLAAATGRRNDLAELVGERGQELSTLKKEVDQRFTNSIHSRVSAINTIETRLTDLIQALSNQCDGLSETLDRAAQKSGTTTQRLDKRIDGLAHDHSLWIADIERKMSEIDSRIDRLGRQ